MIVSSSLPQLLFNTIVLTSITVNGKTITAQASLGDTVSHVMSQIYDKTGIHQNDQRLIHAGRQLDVSCTLGSYDIQKESTLFLVHRMRGGARIHVRASVYPDRFQ